MLLVGRMSKASTTDEREKNVFSGRVNVRAASAQNCALWQQATMEFTRRDHSVIACSRHIYMVLFFMHIPFVVNRAFSAKPAERLQNFSCSR